jgi:glycosyltransferase involved in cell wall biosynthesis
VAAVTANRLVCMQGKSSYILWLPSWYPNELDPFDGDFIQRHAHAASLHNNIHVIFVKADPEGKITGKQHESFTKTETLSEHVIYFKKTGSFLGRFNSFRKWTRLFKKAVKQYIKENGKPEFVHVHVALRAGIIARWIKRKWGIDYFITEHWTGYLPEAEKRLPDFPFYIQIAWRSIMRNAASVSVVSRYLGQCLEKILPGMAFTVIPNVVDTSIFKPADKEKNKTVSFIHISLLNYQKNADDIIRAMSILKTEHLQFQLFIFGPSNDGLVQLVNDLNLQGEIEFHQEIPQVELAKFVQQSDALILYSRYETFGCVIIEANACGIPVIVSDIPVFHENVTEGFNGLFAEPGNPRALARALVEFLEKRHQFDSKNLADHTRKKYSYDTVGKSFQMWYKKIDR